MSGNRRPHTPVKPPVDTEEPLSARVVAMPKESATALPEPAKARERIGDSLRQARLNRGEDLYHIAEYLRIKPAFLVALENSNYDAFPADAYVIGFLRTYATFLGLNGKDAVDRYRFEMAGQRKKPVLAMPQPVTEGRAPSGLIIVAATIALLLIYALWYGVSSSNRAEVTTAPALPVLSENTAIPAEAPNPAAAGLAAHLPTPTSSVPVTASSPTNDTASLGIPLAGTPPQGSIAKDDSPSKTEKDVKKQLPADTASSGGLFIRATQSSWVMITDDSGKAIYDHVLKSGESYKVPNKAGLSLTTGNGSGIILSLNGTDLPPIATGTPHVVRNIPLDADKLSALKAE